MIMDVVAGLIVMDERILVCQRDLGGAFPLKWEFPGGKVEQGEGRACALHRELWEELNIWVTSAREVFWHRHRYADEHWVDLTFFQVESFTGTPENRVFRTVAWATIPELGTLDFLEGDLPLIQKLRQGTLDLTGMQS